MNQTGKQTNWGQFGVLITVFFFWGFVAASNGILIPMFKSKFDLSQFQSQLVDMAFYAAYGIGSLIYFLVSSAFGDPLNKIGYKNGLLLGLLISAIGALTFVPAANMLSYPLFLSGLFIIALGFSLLQIVANPFVINLGNPAYGSHRLNLAGGLNSFGTTIGPVITSFVLFGAIGDKVAKNVEIDLGSLKMLFIALACTFGLLIVLISASKLPKVTSDDKMEKSFSVLKYPQLVLGMLAIFIYVGTEVTIQSNMGALLKTPDFGGMEDAHIAPYISLYWGSLMIGRWTGSLSVFNLSDTTKKILSVVVPFIAFGVILAVNKMYGKDVQELFIYAIWIVIFILASFWSAQKPAKTLIVFGLAAVVMMLVGLCTKGEVALFSFISGGLFCSVMWPCIFNLAIAGLGKYTNQGSSLLIMMIFGGALIPPLQGHLCDMDKTNAGGILGTTFTHFSYIVPVAGFLYLAWYGYKVKGILKTQGIDYESAAGSGH